MALKPIILVGPTTLGGQRGTIVLTGADVPATIFADNLSVAEVVNIFRVTDGGLQGENVFQAGVQLLLSFDNNTITVNSPMKLGIATTGSYAEPVTVYIATQGFA